MRVALDATSLPENRTGVARYLLGLLGGLNRVSPPEVELCVVAKADDLPEIEATAPRAKIFPGGFSSRPLRLAWEQIGLPRLADKIRPDVLHSPHYSTPYIYQGSRVVVLHDATFFSLPETHERTKVAYFRLAARASIRVASRLITVSESARADICSALEIDDTFVDVIHHGVDDVLFEPPDESEITSMREARRLEDRPFVLYLGTVQPRKNIPRLVDAWTLTRRQGSDSLLVLAGGKGWKATEVDEAIRRSDFSDDIRLLGHVTEEEKRNLLAGAAAFVYPSFAEGFGIPVLEAMAAGAPVVTSRISATAEVAGEAALLVDPYVTVEIAEAIGRILEDESLGSKLRASGKKRASEFTWEAAAEKTIACWQQASALHFGAST